MPIKYYYVKLSCPGEDDGFHFGDRMENLSAQNVYKELLTNIPNWLNEANNGDFVFLQLGGDASIKRKYFRGKSQFQDFINGIYGIGIIQHIVPEQKQIELEFYPFLSPVTKMDLYLYPQFIDNLGCVSKGIATQAGLYEVPELTARGFIEYLTLNNIMGRASEVVKDIDITGSLLLGTDQFYKETPELLSLPSAEKIRNFLANGKIKTKSKEIKTSIETLELSKPFLLLAGISGTGKTRFVTQQAKNSAIHYGLTEDDNYCLIPVRPDWHEPSDLLGYVSRISGTKYISTSFFTFMVKALANAVDRIEDEKIVWKDLDEVAPFWLCLDEMNLAPVEQYFADYLSILETRKWEEGYYTSEPMMKPDIFEKLDNGEVGEKNPLVSLWQELFHDVECDFREDLCAVFKKSGVPLPPNLIVAGTVNMDETTHGFSRKVIDRALTIDFQEFFRNDYDTFLGGQKEPKLFTFPPLSQVGNTDLTELTDQAEKSKDFLKAVNNLLTNTPYELAYRALNELLLSVICFAPYEGNDSDLKLQAVWDDFLMQKVLPRIEGDSQKLKFIVASESGISESKYLIEEGNIYGKGSILHQLYALLESTQLKEIWLENMRPDLLRENDEPIQCRSKNKLEWMMKRLKANHFTDFWV